MKTQCLSLTSRESEILNLITYEYSTKDIATELFLSFETIRSHRKNLFKKLQANNLAGLVRIGIEGGYVNLDKKGSN